MAITTRGRRYRRGVNEALQKRKLGNRSIQDFVIVVVFKAFKLGSDFNTADLDLDIFGEVGPIRSYFYSFILLFDTFYFVRLIAVAQLFDAVTRLIRIVIN